MAGKALTIVAVRRHMVPRATESWWFGLDREQFARVVLREQVRMRLAW